jgi:hypothetical protein
MRTVVGAMIVIVSLKAAFAQECLPRPDEVVDINSADSAAAAYHSACSWDFREFDRNWGVRASGFYNAAGGSGAYNENNYNSFKQSRCSTESSQRHESSYRYYVQKALSSAGLQAYEACLLSREGFSCFASPHGEQIVFRVVNNYIFPTEARDASFVSGGVLLQGAFAKGDLIPHGDYRVFVRRERQASVTFVLNVLVHGGGLSDAKGCEAFVAPEVADELPARRCKIVGESSVPVTTAFNRYSAMVAFYRAAKETQVGQIRQRFPGADASANQGMYQSKENFANAIAATAHDRNVGLTNQADSMRHDFQDVLSICAGIEGRPVTMVASVGENSLSECATAVASARAAADELVENAQGTEGDIRRYMAAAAGVMGAPPGLNASKDIGLYTAHVQEFDRNYGFVDAAMSSAAERAARLSEKIRDIKASCAR